VLFYEGRNEKLSPREDGLAAVAFADGHAELIDAARAATLRWAAR
jgi:prepilin-type processing-associated H-X9-DG protein